jgi:hypothetical protein
MLTRTHPCTCLPNKWWSSSIAVRWTRWERHMGARYVLISALMLLCTWFYVSMHIMLLFWIALWKVSMHLMLLSSSIPLFVCFYAPYAASFLNFIVKLSMYLLFCTLSKLCVIRSLNVHVTDLYIIVYTPARRLMCTLYRRKLPNVYVPNQFFPFGHCFCRAR